MTTREQSLLVATAGLVLGGFIVYAAVDSFLLAPAAQADRAIPDLKKKVADHTRVISQKNAYDRDLRAFAGRTFGDNESDVIETMRAHILGLARDSGINTQLDWDTSPFRGGRQRGVYHEVGWSVGARGSLASVVNFLHLLQDDPHLHRIDGFSIAPVPKHTDMKINLRYASLVLGPKVVPKGRPATSQPTSQPVFPTLAGAGRKQYAAITARDLFRPYVKKPVVRRTTPTPKPKPKPVPRPPAKAPVETRLKVVSLALLGDKPEVCVMHLDTLHFTRYAEGDKLLGGLIEMVDYRPMPHAENPRILSTSRAIVKVGQTYWAVELGQTLSQKRRLGASQLPPRLQGIIDDSGKKVSSSADSH